MYVNTTDLVGCEDDELALAQRLEDGSYLLNAYAKYENGEVTAIIFDVNNDLDDTAGHKDDADGTKTGTAGYAISASGTPTNISSVATEYDYACEGEYVKVTATLSAANDGATLTATAAATGIKANTGTITLPASDTAAGDTFDMYVLIERAASGTPITGPITITVA